MNEQELLSSVRGVVLDVVKTEIPHQLEPIKLTLRNQGTRSEALHEGLSRVERKLDGDDSAGGVIAQLARVEIGVREMKDLYEKCTARRKHEANSTAADGIAALTQAGARAVLANDSVPPNRVQVAREKTKQERLRLARRIATVVGLVLVGGAGGAGLLQLLTPAQASQPAAAQAP